MPEILLASDSPRRRELLQLTGWPIATGAHHVPESRLPGEGPVEFTQRLARKKAGSHTATSGLAGLVLGSDTVVVDGERILGKPASEAEARATLTELRGRAHRVVSSIAVVDHVNRVERVDTCISRVPMRDYSDDELEAYLSGGSPLDKAGSYGIQDAEFEPVDMDQMRDCFANVMGLPLCHLARTMRSLGYEPPNDVPQACVAHTGYDCTVYPDILEGRA